jgi:hypothetical protein
LGGSWFRASLGKQFFKKSRAKWTVDVAQVVEYLLHMCEALSSNLIPTKKKKMMSFINLIYIFKSFNMNKCSNNEKEGIYQGEKQPCLPQSGFRIEIFQSGSLPITLQILLSFGFRYVALVCFK